MLTVAHRAGNTPATLRATLAAGVDLVEADLRYFRGRVEVRHLKTFGPWWLWDHPWEVVSRRRAEIATLPDVLGHDADARLLLDLKGVHPHLAPAVAATLRAVASGVPVAVCSRHWWMFDAFEDQPAVRLVPSAGSARQLRRLVGLLDRAAVDWPGRRRAYAVSVKRSLLTPGTVDALRERVRHVIAWPVDSPWALGHARSLGVTGVTGKNLPLLREAGGLS